VRLPPDDDLQRIALLNEIAFLVVGEPDPDLPSAEPERADSDESSVVSGS